MASEREKAYVGGLATLGCIVATGIVGPAVAAVALTTAATLAVGSIINGQGSTSGDKKD